MEIQRVPLTSTGCDKLQFLVSANKGEPPKPMSKIASGGELSRIMLAIKTVLAGKDKVATLIFDEVDTGISGAAANKVGQKLKQVSQNRQVLCITHLAQIAALADHHLRITKHVKDGRTFTQVEPPGPGGEKAGAGPDHRRGAGDPAAAGHGRGNDKKGLTFGGFFPIIAPMAVTEPIGLVPWPREPAVGGSGSKAGLKLLSRAAAWNVGRPVEAAVGRRYSARASQVIWRARRGRRPRGPGKLRWYRDIHRPL